MSFYNNSPRMIDCDEEKSKRIETVILSVLKAEEVSLSQARCLFANIIDKIEDKNLINL